MRSAAIKPGVVAAQAAPSAEPSLSGEPAGALALAARGYATSDAVERARIAPGPPMCSLEAVDRRLPSAAEALRDVTFPERRPAEIPVDPQMVAMLLAARRVLVVGHVPPDADCVGSALALARALRAAGKEAEVCIDSELPGNLRGFAEPGELKRAAELNAADYDLLAIVDVAERGRIGAVATLLDSVGSVIAIDHHRVAPSREALGIAPDAKLAYTIAPTAESTSYLVAGFAAAFAAERGADFSPGQWQAIAAPIAAAAYADTQAFSVAGTALGSLSLFKHLLRRHFEGDLDAVLGPMNYVLPHKGRSVLQHLAPTQLETPHGCRVGIIEATLAASVSSLEAARQADAQSNLLDIKGHLQDRLDALKDSALLGILLYEEPGGVRVSLRSVRADDAPQMAKALGGGGKENAGGAFVAGSMQEVRTRLDALVEQWALREALRLRMLGSMV